jgi:LPS export ABC transporter protein LptC
MRRTRLRAALLLVVAAALGGIGYLVSRSVAARRTDPLRELGQDFLPQVAQRIQNFRRLKVKDGRTVWQITAKDAQYFEKGHQIVVREPRMTLYVDTGGRIAHIAGAEGRIVLDGRELQSLALRGHVAVDLDGLRLETDEATYDREHDLLVSPGVVTVRGQTLEVHGRGMEVKVGPQHVRLLGDVRTVIRSDAAGS